MKTLAALASRRVATGLLVLLVTGCSQKIEDQPKLEVYETSEFFEDGLAMRPPVEGTVPRGGLRLATDDHFLKGMIDGKPAAGWPGEVTIDRAFVDRGRERFNAYCSMCHGYAGDGDGMVVKRGFPAPPSYHVDRLREVPNGHIFDVVTNGLGRMPRLSDRIPPRERWAIVAYVRALQLSQHTAADDELRTTVDEAVSEAEQDTAPEHDGESTKSEEHE